MFIQNRNDENNLEKLFSYIKGGEKNKIDNLNNP